MVAKEIPPPNVKEQFFSRKANEVGAAVDVSNITYALIPEAPSPKTIGIFHICRFSGSP